MRKWLQDFAYRVDIGCLFTTIHNEYSGHIFGSPAISTNQGMPA